MQFRSCLLAPRLPWGTSRNQGVPKEVYQSLHWLGSHDALNLRGSYIIIQTRLGFPGSIQYGVSIGYDGPCGQRKAPNLPSAKLHPEVIEAELSKEHEVKRILRPFTYPPYPNLRCSGLGVVLKKQGKWRMILHLSAPEGSSINNGVSKDSFYSTPQLMMQ